MKLSVIFPVFNQPELAEQAIRLAVQNCSGENKVEVIILDNGSDAVFNPFGREHTLVPVSKEMGMASGDASVSAPEILKTVDVKTIRLEKNIGVYPTFWEGLKHTDGDIVAYLHSDTIVAEKGWDTRVLDVFKNDPGLGLVGFIGSNEIDGSGGRGGGTISNFQGGELVTRKKDGETVRSWKGSPAEAHGRRTIEMVPAAVVDGCAMIFRRSVLEAIPERKDFPPHHFYDRLLSCEVRERGFRMGTLGIACDHISGQTVNQENGYSTMAEAWAKAHGLEMGTHHNWDTVLYLEAERQWLSEYRDAKHLVPVVV